MISKVTLLFVVVCHIFYVGLSKSLLGPYTIFALVYYARHDKDYEYILSNKIYSHLIVQTCCKIDISETSRLNYIPDHVLKKIRNYKNMKICQ